MAVTPTQPHFECVNPADVITSCLPGSPLRGLADVVSAFGLAEIGGWPSDLADRIRWHRRQPASFGDALHPVRTWDPYAAAATDTAGYPFQHTVAYVRDGYCQRLADRINSV
ncbi:hypothetical protein [Nocardia sp. NPDC059228]|uniref:hypothetical protein n=1 Tax=Nocardia sp. NPDC059228 TaxID=3346777 RepID=UPI00369950AA